MFLWNLRERALVFIKLYMKISAYCHWQLYLNWKITFYCKPIELVNKDRHKLYCFFFFLTSSQIILGFLSTDDLSLFLKDENTLGTPAIRFATRLSLFWVRFPRKRIHVTFLRNNNREVKRVFRKRGFSLCIWYDITYICDQEKRQN